MAVVSAPYDLSTDLAQKIKKQLEFYFSDSNYPRDLFLRSQAAENAGYIPIAVFKTFNRIKALTDDTELIKSIFSTIENLEVKDDKVKRTTPLPEKDTSRERTIVVSGLPKTGITIETLSEFFSKYGPTLSIRFRRQEKEFTGCAFVEFEKAEDAEKVAALKELEYSPDVKISLLKKSDLPKEDKRKPKEKEEKKKKKKKNLQR